MNLTSWFLKIHEGDSHIPTIEVDARSRSPPFVVVEVVFCWNPFSFFHFKELVNRRITSKSTKSYSMKEREQRIQKL